MAMALVARAGGEGWWRGASTTRGSMRSTPPACDMELEAPFPVLRTGLSDVVRGAGSCRSH